MRLWTSKYPVNFGSRLDLPWALCSPNVNVSYVYTLLSQGGSCSVMSIY